MRAFCPLGFIFQGLQIHKVKRLSLNHYKTGISPSLIPLSPIGVSLLHAGYARRKITTQQGCQRPLDSCSLFSWIKWSKLKEGNTCPFKDSLSLLHSSSLGILANLPERTSTQICWANRVSEATCHFYPDGSFCWISERPEGQRA